MGYSVADEQVKAPPDTDLQVEVSKKAESKVALDIEGADFLKEIEPEAPPPSLKGVNADGTLALSEEDQELAQKKKKKIVMASGGILLILIAFAVWWFGIRTPSPPPPPPLEPEIVVVPSQETLAQSAPKEYIVHFAPYWIPLPDGQGGDVFLVCTFAIVTGNINLKQEVENKIITLRDAVYYYLINKPYQFLTDATNVRTIKRDLDSVFSGYLTTGKIDGLLFEGYISK